MTKRALLPLLLLALAAEVFAAAEHPNFARGFQAEQVYHVSDIDSVNVFNGNITAVVPIGGRHSLGGSFGYSLQLVYNSKLWDVETGYSCPQGTPMPIALPNRTSNSGFGWLLTLGRFVAPLSNESGEWRYVASDGALHEFTALTGSTTGEFTSNDLSNLRLQKYTDGTRILMFPNGDRQWFDANGRLVSMSDRHGNYATVTYSTALAPWGGEPLQWTIRDHTADHAPVRTTEINFATTNSLPGWDSGLGNLGANYNLVLRSVVFKDPAGDRTYTFDYYNQGTSYIERARPGTPTGCGSQVLVPFLQRITQPDQTTFEVDYLLPGGPVMDSQGAIESITLPTKGIISYEYQELTLPEKACCRTGDYVHSAGVYKRKLSNGSLSPLAEWTYNHQHGPQLSYTCDMDDGCRDNETGGTPITITIPDYKYTAVTAPDGKTTRYYFTVGPDSLHEVGAPFSTHEATDTTLFLSSEVLCSGCTSPQRTFVEFEGGEYRSGVPRKRQRTIYENGEWIESANSEHQGYGLYRTQETRSSFEAGVKRTTTTEYNPPPDANSWSPYFVGQVREQTVTQTRPNTTGDSRRSLFCYDAANGVLLKQLTMSNPTGQPQATDLLVTYAYDGHGNLTDERFYGGDSAPLANPPSVTTFCSWTPTGNPEYTQRHAYTAGIRRKTEHVTSTGSVVSLDLDVNAVRGLVTASRERGLTALLAQYEYDSMGRLTRILPVQAVTGPARTGEQRFTYNPATAASESGSATVTAVRKDANGATVGETVYSYDGFGRLRQENVWRPPAEGSSSDRSIRDIVYDGQGRKKEVSELRALGAIRTFTAYAYDALGRPSSVAAPDGHTTTFSYTGAQLTHRTSTIQREKLDAVGSSPQETPTTVIEKRDTFGRLVQVDEPLDAGVTSVTKYTYNVADQLIEVKSGVKTTGDPTFEQTRTFSYDNRGLLTSESHPEMGVTTNGTHQQGSITYSDFDARGRAQAKTDNGSLVRFTYDQAERLTHVTDAATNKNLKVFEYAGANLSASNLTKDRLRAATRYNYNCPRSS